MCVDDENHTFRIGERTKIDNGGRFQGSDAVMRDIGWCGILGRKGDAAGQEPQPQQANVVERRVGNGVDLAA
jgi:hypothetical protein